MWSRRIWRWMSWILIVIGALGAIATILQWAETSQWLPTWGRVLLMLPWTPIVWLVLLALILIGLSRVWALEQRLDGVDQLQATVSQRVGGLLSQGKKITAEVEALRTELDERINRLNRSINDLLIEIQKEQRTHGVQLSELGQRLSQLERLPTIAREREAVKANEAYNTEPYPMADGTIWTRRRIDALPEQQRERLFEETPGLADWWLGKPLE